MADGEDSGPAQGFAALMSEAAKDAAPDGDAAPFGMTRDRETGELRPKKTPGRPRSSPSIEDLKAARDQAAATGAPDGPPADRAPGKPGRGSRSKIKTPPGTPAEPVPQHRPGIITKGVNRLYRRAGKFVKAMDRDIGIAVIESTKNTAEDGEPDDSVGAAWDELARTNPRIRVFLLRIIAGGAWGQLVMAHAPIAMAIVMKDGIRKHIPFMKLIEALAADDDEGAVDGVPVPAGGLGGLLAGMRPEDMQQMAAMAQRMMGQTAAGMADGPAAAA